MNLANFLTLCRFGLSGLLVYFLFADGPSSKYLALAVFVLGCATDYLDGKIARRLKEITPLGQLLDPIADKALNYGALLSFAFLSIIPGWIVGVMLTREIFVTLVRVAGLRTGAAVSAESLGKIKTISQDVVIVAVLLFLIFSETGWWNEAWTGPARAVILAAMLGVLILTLASGLSYVLGRFRRAHAGTR